MTTIPQNEQLLNHLTQLLQAHRPIFKQERVFQRVALLVIAEIVVFARHTITQLLMGVGLTDLDWSSWYRLFSHSRFPYDAASEVLFGQTVPHVAADEWYVVAGDGTQTRRSSRKMEGRTGCTIHNHRFSNGAFILRNVGSTAVGCCQPKMATVGQYRCAGYQHLLRNHNHSRPFPARNGKQPSPFWCG